jgi:phosphatidylserine/phosphatidylglycerophosphate/cardiolipin synthase-like enzyme
MFFLSHRKVIAALKSAHARGARIRVILDPNRTAFGIRRNGIPNTPVAAGLKHVGIPVRWCDPHGEQCHSKIMMVSRADGQAWMTLGSTNFTRRNLDDFNPETNIVVRGSASARIFREANEWFELNWNNERDRRLSVPYNTYDDESPLKAALYRFMEGTGWSTF